MGRKRVGSGQRWVEVGKGGQRWVGSNRGRWQRWVKVGKGRQRRAWAGEGKGGQKWQESAEAGKHIRRWAEVVYGWTGMGRVFRGWQMCAEEYRGLQGVRAKVGKGCVSWAVVCRGRQECSGWAEEGRGEQKWAEVGSCRKR
jgi:hypothetical protein